MVPERLARIVGVLGLAAALGCVGGPPQVEAESYYDENADFSVKRYAWLDATPERLGTRANDPAVHEAIRVAIDATLAAKGLERVVPAEADLLVTYHLAIREALEARTINREYYGDDWDFTPPRTAVTRYEQGKLVIDLSAARTRRVVWRGTGRARLSDAPVPEDRMRTNVYYAVTAILRDFPPPAVSAP